MKCVPILWVLSFGKEYTEASQRMLHLPSTSKAHSYATIKRRYQKTHRPKGSSVTAIPAWVGAALALSCQWAWQSRDLHLHIVDSPEAEHSVESISTPLSNCGLQRILACLCG